MVRGTKNKMNIKELFGNKRIVGIAGEKSSGKTNNLCAMIKEFRAKNKTTEIYIYGFNKECVEYLKKLGNVFVFSKLEHIRRKSNCLIVMDEFQKLKLGDRRYKEVRDDFVDMIYHKERNNWAILSSPNIREFNSIIGSIIERWGLKSLAMDDLVNGSQLSKVVEEYKGEYKIAKVLEIPKDKMLVINDEREIVLDIEYLKEIDGKIDCVDIFEIDDTKKNCRKKGQ